MKSFHQDRTVKLLLCTAIISAGILSGCSDSGGDGVLNTTPQPLTLVDRVDSVGSSSFVVWSLSKISWGNVSPQAFSRLRVIVTENAGNNIEFSILHHGRVAFSSGVYVGSRETMLSTAGQDLRDYVVKVENENILDTKIVRIQIIAER